MVFMLTEMGFSKTKIPNQLPNFMSDFRSCLLFPKDRCDLFQSALVYFLFLAGTGAMAVVD
jgi:hypothetical protein